MPIDTTVWNLDLGYMIADLPASLTWNAFTGIPCAMTELARGQLLTLAGNIDEQHFEVIFQASLVTGYPLPTNRITLTPYWSPTPTNYEVVDANVSPDGVSITLIVKADHRA